MRKTSSRVVLPSMTNWLTVAASCCLSTSLPPLAQPASTSARKIADMRLGILLPLLTIACCGLQGQDRLSLRLSGRDTLAANHVRPHDPTRPSRRPVDAREAHDRGRDLERGLRDSEGEP